QLALKAVTRIELASVRIMGLNYVEWFAESLNEIKRGRGICSIRKVSLLTFFNAHRENRFTIEARNIICIIRGTIDL
ncbi:hypothetical protein AB6C93_25765, partial [Vibrio splendidus]